MGNESVFTGRAREYAASRPSYAPEAIGLLFSRLIAAGETAADIGSGTGILSGEFLERGYDVFCVEPNAQMRAEAVRRYGSDPRFHSVAASAEHTRLQSGSISLVTAASSFHWFDVTAFRTECRRILRPGGMVCILANARTDDAFTRAQHRLCMQYCRGYCSLTHGAEKVLRRADDFFGSQFCLERFDFPLHYTKEKFIARSLSSSYAPERGSAACGSYIRSLRQLLDDFFPEEHIEIANSTVMLWGTLNKGD